jgi:hypothetical protein
MVFENTGGFTHAQSAGAFAWQQPVASTGGGTNITTAIQTDWKSGTYMDNWYNAANTTYASKLAFGMALKGFDSETASWYYPDGRVISQQCGQTWLNSFAENNGHTNINLFRCRRGMTTKKAARLKQASITVSPRRRSRSQVRR